MLPRVWRSRSSSSATARLISTKLFHGRFLSTTITPSSMSSSTTTIQSWRERSPSSYSLKIQNFSQFQKSTLSSDHKYQSALFSSGGYDWRMILYPKGYDKESGFISMYVEIDKKSISTPTTEVFADLRFQVYNKKENKYFTIQDVESKPFNTFRRIWGLPQVLQLDTFNDPKNGYIFGGDECEFGVDVIVAPPPTKWETISFVEKPSHSKFSWTIKNFFELKEKRHSSESFSMGGRNWVLKLDPKGYTRGDGKWLSIYLYLADSETIQNDEKIFTRFHFRVLDPFGSNDITKKTKYWHDDSNLGWGYHELVSIAKLREGYLDKEGTLRVEVELEVLSTTKYYPII